MIYDAFSFFNELDLLELRLKTLESVVDRFILVEATRTHTGHPKPLFFQENKSRFSTFLDRIEHIVVDDYPPFENAWTFENHQRNCIVRGLSNAKPDDWILVSDLDEIPNPRMIEKCVQRPGRYRFNQKFYAYWLNLRCLDRPRWYGTRLLLVSDFLHGLDNAPFSFNRCALEAVNRGTTATKWRYAEDVGWKTVLRGGWHFTSIGGPDAVAVKAGSFAETQFGTEKNQDPDYLRRMLDRGQGPFHKRLVVRRVDKTFPIAILNQPDIYSRFMLKTDSRRLFRDKFRFAFRFGVEEMIERVRPIIPKSIRPMMVRLRGWAGI